jgi:osmotically-inducible protein OsmY
MHNKLHNSADERLRDMVLNQLAWEPLTRANGIAVDARDGAVTLAGTVDTWYEKFTAATAAASVHGVRAVANDIQVKPTGRSDSEIAHDIAEAFRIDSTIPQHRLRVVVSEGTVMLEGIVDWHYQRLHACECAGKVSGVRVVNDKILIKSAPSTATVKAEITEALRRSARISTKNIDVLSDGGIVTLSGNVRSLAEREAAEKAAWAAPGVTQVIDRLAIVPG